MSPSPKLLFDAVDRDDSAPGRHTESTFAFLNRVDAPYWATIRDELDGWFLNYPDAHAADLRARFRSARPGQHWGAWWELYLFTLFSRLGFELEVHPSLPGYKTHPDFRATRSGEEFYLEAATVFSGIVEEGRDATRESWILDAIDHGKSANFFVGVDFGRVGAERPRVQEITRPIEHWLWGLDPDDVTARMRGGERPPELHLPVRDWLLEIEAYPIKPEARGRPGHRLLGRGPMSGGMVNDVDQTQKKLRQKLGHYGPLPAPLVVGLLSMSSFFEPLDMEQALYGREAVQFETDPPHTSRLIRQRNGVWMGPRGPRGTAVSAVLSASGLQPSTVTSALPQLWVNPWAERPFALELPFRTATAEETGQVIYDSERERSPAEIFGLAADWPGHSPWKRST